MPVIRVRGIALPDGDVVDLYAAGGRWTADPVPGAELAADGWLLPGLVDAHTHPGAEAPGNPLDEAVLREDLREHLAAGVTLIRAPGLAGDPPGWFGRDDGVPRATHAGPWIAQHGQFFDGWGRRADLGELPELAAAQAARSGRLAVHSQQSDGGAAAVAAGVDSLEHGMCFDPALLPQMARQGTALIPTLSVITGSMATVRDRPDSPRKQWYLAGAEAHARLAAAAAEEGVTLLAGTDSRPCGRVIDEIRALADAGVPAHAAVGAASWAAREYLGMAGLREGAPADAVVYDADPRTDLSQLAAPRAVILRGQVRYRRP